MEKETKKTITWEIKRVDAKEKTDKFYIMIIIAMAILLLFSVWQKNFLFGVFIILTCSTIFYFASQKPETYSFSINDMGIIIGNNEVVYEYDKFSHFDIFEYGAGNDYEILLVFKTKLRPILRIRIYKNDKEKIKEFLLLKLPQKKTEPSILDIFSRKIGI
jgi:hypothetical protein